MEAKLSVVSSTSLDRTVIGRTGGGNTWHPKRRVEGHASTFVRTNVVTEARLLDPEMSQ